MNTANLIAPCGLVCTECPMHLAQDSPGLKISLSDSLGISIENVACGCCREEQGVTTYNKGSSSPCHVFACSREKGVQFCCDCAEFPCERYQPYAHRAAEVPHNLKMYNLGLIKKLGIDAFIAQFAKKSREAYFKGKLKCG